MQRHLRRHDPHQFARLPQPPASPFQVELEIIRGQAKQRLRPVLGPAFLIGTAEDCDLVLGDPQFSEVHAYIRISEDGVSLRHLGFNPPLTINGVVAWHAPLTDGDRLRTGPYEFQIHIRRLAGGDETRRGVTPMMLPAALDRVEDEVGSALVQQLIEQIRHDLLPHSAGLKLYAAPDAAVVAERTSQSPGPEGKPTSLWAQFVAKC